MLLYKRPHRLPSGPRVASPLPFCTCDRLLARTPADLHTMKISTCLALLASLALSANANLGQPMPTPEPLALRSNGLAPRQDAASLSSRLSSIKASSEAFFSSVTKSDSTTAFSSATGFACKGLTLGNDKCCDTGIIINRQCWVVPDADGISVYGNTDDYDPFSSPSGASSASSSSAASSSSSSSGASSAASSVTSSSASRSASLSASSSAPASTSSSPNGALQQTPQGLAMSFVALLAVGVGALI
ncbi:unnamed protein product [Parajaminaea phylloscopi]